MGWSIGYDSKWNRDIGYGVPAVCDHPSCTASIDRGLSYVCGGDPYGGDHGCGLYFCPEHRQYRDFEDGCSRSVCERCADESDDPPPEFDAKPDCAKWVQWKLTHSSWKEWRGENPDEVARLTASQRPQTTGEQKT